MLSCVSSFVFCTRQTQSRVLLHYTASNTAPPSFPPGGPTSRRKTQFLQTPTVQVMHYCCRPILQVKLLHAEALDTLTHKQRALIAPANDIPCACTMPAAHTAATQSNAELKTESLKPDRLAYAIGCMSSTTNTCRVQVHSTARHE